jgi:hypothetical protein
MAASAREAGTLSAGEVTRLQWKDRVGRDPIASASP